jgi:ferredoxin
MQEFINSKVRVSPGADRDLCTACGACIDQCPAGALSMVDGFPAADMDLCVTCFCCQEICPEKAMTLS